MADNDILARLSGFIDYESPELAEFLYGMWGDQANAITYHELRDAIMDGSLSLDYLRQWQQDYSRFITEAYAPRVDRAVAQAAADLRREYGADFHDPMFSKVDSFIQTNGGQLIRQVSVEQYQAVNALVRQAALTNTLTVDQAARAIRPCVGLTRRQAQTTKRFYDNLIEEGYSHKRAHERQLVYAAKIHRRRAALIAQTEMARAYSYGWHATIQQNVEDGILPPGTRKVWLTAEDEKVCPECGKMNGESVLWNEPFSNGSLYPPAHPNCRCHHKIDFVDLLPQAQIHAEEPPVQRAQAQIAADGDETAFTSTEAHGQVVETQPSIAQQYTVRSEDERPKYLTPEDYDVEIDRLREQRRALFEADGYDKAETDRLLQQVLDLEDQKADFSIAYNFSGGDIRLVNMIRSGDAQQIGTAVEEVLDGLGFSRPSKWSKKIITETADSMPDALGEKRWNCDIAIRADSINDLKVQIHENLHARSASHFSEETYRTNKPTEEGAVELMAQQICERRGVPYTPAYTAYVDSMKDVRTILFPKMSEYDYAKKMLDIAEDKRYSYIGERIAEYKDAHPRMRTGTRKRLDKILKTLQG